LAVFTAFNILANYKFPLNEALCEKGIMEKFSGITVVGKTANFNYEGVKATVTLTRENIVNAMDVVGFQDQGREKVIETIQDKFQDLLVGKIDSIPVELIDYSESILSVVEYLAKNFT